MSQEPTTKDILEAVSVLSSHIDERLDKLEQRMDKTESLMVTKDYLDDKLADLRGDLVVLTRKEDHKVRELISILQKKNVLNTEEVQHLLQLEPFPTLAL